MSILIQKLFQHKPLTPILQFQRYRGKINIQRPRAPHYERARVLAVTKPIYAPKPINNRCFPVKKTNNNEELSETKNPYDHIIAKEIINWFQYSQMIGIYQINSITADDLFKVQVKLFKQNIHMKRYGYKVIQLALNSTKYETILPLFQSNYYILFSKDANNIKNLLKITKRVPQMLLLGGILNNNVIMNRNELIEYSQLPDLQTLQNNIVHTLQLASGQMLINNLEKHQNDFTNTLDVYSKSIT